MKAKGSEIFVKTLKEYNIDHIFGNPGTTELPIIQSADKLGIKYIMTLHEDIAVSSATGYSLRLYDYYLKDKVDTPVSVVNLHTTPGLLHGSGNIYNSKFDKAPMIVTTGSQDPDLEDLNPSLSGNRKKIIESLVKWSTKIEDPSNIPKKLRKAVRTSLTPPTGPVFVDIPLNVQREISDVEIPPLGDIPENLKNKPVLESNIIQKIRDSEDTIIFAGDSIAFEDDKTKNSILNFAHNIGARVYGEVLCSRSIYPYSDERWIGSLSPNEDPTQFSSDLNIYIGCTSNNTIVKSKKESSDTETIIISNRSKNSNNHTRCDHSISGHIGSIVSGINTIIESESTNKTSIKECKNERKQRMDAFRSKEDRDEFVSKYELARVINNILSDDIIFDEGVTSGFVLRNYLNKDDIELFGLKGGGLGQGMGASVGIAIAEDYMGSDKRVVSYIGDGSYQYYPQSLYTASKYTERLTYIIPDNSGYEILQNNSMIDSENKSLQFNDIDIISISESYGVLSESYEFNRDIEDFTQEYINCDKNTLITIPVY